MQIPAKNKMSPLKKKTVSLKPTISGTIYHGEDIIHALKQLCPHSYNLGG